MSDVDCIKPCFCFVHYRFDIANTGASLRNEVTIIFHDMPREALWGRRVLPLITESTHTADAEILREIQDDEVVIIIDDFQPSTLVKLEFIDKRMPRDSGELLLQGVVEVIATAGPSWPSPRPLYSDVSSAPCSDPGSASPDGRVRCRVHFPCT